MAANDPFQFEDQTDEDFFDKLVGDDEFGLGGSDSVPSDIVRAVSSLSISDQAAPNDGIKEEKLFEDKSVVAQEPPEKITLIPENVNPISMSNSLVHQESVSPGSSEGMSGGSKGTSIKEVQWTAFSSGSFSDFFSEIPGQSANQISVSKPDPSSDHSSLNGFMTSSHQSEVQTKLALVENVSNSNGSENSENAHPGWKYDASTGQWHQIDGHDSTAAQTDSYTSTVENKEEVSLSSTQSIFGTMDQTSNGSSGYPSNMVFDPQYPGWYYDTNASQWFSLESYTQSLQATSAALSYEHVHIPSTSDVSHSAQTSRQNSVISDPIQFQQSNNQVNQEHGDWSTNSSYQQFNTWNPNESDNAVSAPGFSPSHNIQNIIESRRVEQKPPDKTSQFFPTIQAGTHSFSAFAHSESQNFSSFYDLQHKEQKLPDQTVQFFPSIQAGTHPFSALAPSESQNFSSNYDSRHEEQKLPDQTAQSVPTIQGGSNSFLALRPSKSHNLSSFHDSQHEDQKLSDRTGQFVPTNQGGSNSFSAFASPENHNFSSFYGSQHETRKLPDQTTTFIPSNSFSAFMPRENNFQPSQPIGDQNYFMNQNFLRFSQFNTGELASTSQFHPRSVDGRPPHALVTFGFGGKLILMKDSTYGNQETGKREIKILNMAELEVENSDSSMVNTYFQVLCKQPFPGPLVGGNASIKDLNKWIEERITSYDMLTMDGRKAELSKLLLSLLKISCQYYGKLRSPFGADLSLQEGDSPEIAVTRLFSSAKKSDYGEVVHCMRGLPSEAQIMGTALKVQNLLVSGRRKEALECAQEGQLWGPALVLAAQLGDKFYIETVKQMAHRQFASGSPLRTLYLLIAGQPADVFSGDNSVNNLPGISSGGMLDDWEENLAIIAGNRTKDDELVIINLGDCLWKETGEVTAAHMCYLVAEAKFESYSDKARMCLIGADHWRCPRTYASPEAIQRTEIFEYSKVTGNSQYVLLPFQPYKLIYAYMLAEVGKVSDSLKYCQAITKSLKSSGRDPEVEMWKGMVSSLEERLRAHQQGGYSVNLAPGKIVGKLFTSLDRSLHRMIGAPPPSPSLPPLPPGHDSMSMMPSRAGISQSVMSTSALVSSASVETISGWTGDSRKTIHSRSISEPDFGRSPKQEQINPGAKSSEGQSKSQGGSRLGLFGSQFIQKTVGWMSRSRQAKLGESNKFYYDEKLKRWVEEGAEIAAEAPPLPPPPTSSAFPVAAQPQPMGMLSSTSAPPENLLFNGISEDRNAGFPPAPPSVNQFSARSRMGVRSRYVDTFNKGATTPSFHVPSIPAAKPLGNAKFFVPGPVVAEEATQPIQEHLNPASSASSASSSSSSSSSSSIPSSSPASMQRFPSMDNISSTRKSRGMAGSAHDTNGSLGSRTRASSWSGTYPDPSSSSLSLSSSSEMKQAGGPQFFSPNNGPISLANGRGFGDDLQEVEL